MRYFLLVLVFFCYFDSFSQLNSDHQLAEYYFLNNEFSKALPYCEKIFLKENNKFTFLPYYRCLTETKNLKLAEKLLKKQISNEAESEVEYSLLLADFYIVNERIKESEKIHQDLIKNHTNSLEKINELFNLFLLKEKFDLALQVLTDGRKKFHNKISLGIQFAQYYSKIGDKKQMIDELLRWFELENGDLNKLEWFLSSTIDFSIPTSDDLVLLEETLIEKSQKKVNELPYAELMLWFYTQRKSYRFAIKQAISIDKRFNEDGLRLFDLGTQFIQQKEYKFAREAYQYVINYGSDNDYFSMSQGLFLNSFYCELTEQRNFSPKKIDSVIVLYKETLAKFGDSKFSISIQKELAYILSFYGNRINEGIQLLTNAIKNPSIDNAMSADLNMLLADLYVMDNDIWEASLIYMNLEQKFKYEPIGFEAKFKNARVFYYDGDFKFAQAQLDVLKESTSKLIANDALRLSLLITDNLGIDSNYTAMYQFAQADLLLEQHKFIEAFMKFDSIQLFFPMHGLQDEILFRKASAFQYQGRWKEAIELLESIILKYNDDILADDAIFELAKIYEYHLFNKEKAAEYYKKIVIDYKGSLFSIEARKKLRFLRGDVLEDGIPPN